MRDLETSNLLDIYNYCKSYLDDTFSVLQLIKSYCVIQNKELFLTMNIDDNAFENLSEKVRYICEKVISKIYPSFDLNLITINITKSDFDSINVDFEFNKPVLKDALCKEFTSKEFIRLDRKRKLKRVKYGR